jgi:hypothetical protein
MNGTDKTGDKLVASIRKTKAGAAKPKQAAPAKAVKTRRVQSGKPAAKSRRTTAAGSADPYSCGGRVWPD